MSIEDNGLRSTAGRYGMSLYKDHTSCRKCKLIVIALHVLNTRMVHWDIHMQLSVARAQKNAGDVELALRLPLVCTCAVHRDCLYERHRQSR